MSWQDWQDQNDEKLLVTDEVEMEINIATKVIGKIKIGLFGKERVRAGFFASVFADISTSCKRQYQKQSKTLSNYRLAKSAMVMCWDC